MSLESYSLCEAKTLLAIFLYFCVFSCQSKDDGFSDGFFHVVLHKIFPHSILARSKLIIYDGDQQKCGSINSAVRMFMNGA